MVIALVRLHQGEPLCHVLIHRRAFLRVTQCGEDLFLCLIIAPVIRRNIRFPVRVAGIECDDVPGKLYLFILGGICHFLRGQVSAAFNKLPNPFLHLVPVQPYRVIAFKTGNLVATGKFDPFRIVPFIIPGMAVSSGSVFIPQECGAFFGVMPLHKIGIDPHLCFGYAAAPGEHTVDLILRDKAGPCRLKAFQCGKFLWFRGQKRDAGGKPERFMEMETEKIVVSVIFSGKPVNLVHQTLPCLRICQAFRQFLRTVRESVVSIIKFRKERQRIHFLSLVAQILP